MDVAFNTQAATKFCQIRDIYEDPNEWQFWLQTGYDTRIRDWHEKVYRCNEQKNESLDLSLIHISQETIARPEAYKLISQERRMLSGASKAKLLNVAMVNASSV